MSEHFACKQSLSITGVILAGGMARRMNGQDKGLIPLAGQHMIQYVLQRLSPQVEQIYINANRNEDIYAAYGFPVIKDSLEGFAGPLAGIASVMDKITTSHLLIVPCDTPQIPHDLVDRLSHDLSSHNAEIAVAHDGKRMQPVFALIAKSTLASLSQYLEKGERKIDRWYAQHKLVTTDFSDNVEAFTNINTPEEIQNIETKMFLESITIPIIGFTAHSGTGKTTLLKKVIPLLHDQNLRIGIVKHAHHGFEIDYPGKDSYELRKAGASQVLVGSKTRWALVVETPEREEKASLTHLLEQLDHHNLDMILVEGFKLESIPKIEVYRPSLGKPRLSENTQGYIAIACDDLTLKTKLPLLDLNQPQDIADFLTDKINP